MSDKLRWNCTQGGGELRRIVLPIELRRALCIAERGDGLEIYVDGESIVLKKYAAPCTFCGSDHDGANYKGKNICAACLKNLRKLDY